MLMIDKRRKPHHIALDNTAFYAKCEKKTQTTDNATEAFKRKPYQEDVYQYFKRRLKNAHSNN